MRAYDVRDVVLRLFLEQVEERGNAQPEIGVPRVEAVFKSAQPPLHQDLDGLLRNRVGPVDELVGQERSGNGVVVLIPGKKKLLIKKVFEATLVRQQSGHQNCSCSETLNPDGMDHHVSNSVIMARGPVSCGILLTWGFCPLRAIVLCT